MWNTDYLAVAAAPCSIAPLAFGLSYIGPLFPPPKAVNPHLTLEISLSHYRLKILLTNKNICANIVT